MCGICGILDFDAKPINREIIKKMTSLLFHRGPDEEGFYLKKTSEYSIAMGHRRLSIIDIDLGKQPMSNSDSSVWIVFNGEIYNFRELRDELVKLGFSFKTNSDTEVIIKAYERWGEDFVNKLRGMFAFGLWDEGKKKLILARDRIGIKPLYFWVKGSKILFASEIKSLLAYPEVNRAINPYALWDFFSLLYIPSPKTIFQNIFKLKPGHILVFTKDGIKEKEFWDLTFSKKVVREEDLIEELIEKFEESVKIRLISEVTLGAFLSGGVDSSSVVAVMSKFKDKVITNSIGFEEKGFNELPYAKRVAKLYSCEHKEYTVTPDIEEAIQKLSYYFDEPFGDSSSIPSYYVCKIARQNMTVALSGDGGDENFAGYRRYFYHVLETRLRNLLPDFFKRSFISFIAELYPKADWLPQIFRAKTLLKNLTKSHSKAYFLSVSQISSDHKRKLFSEEFKKEIKDYKTYFLFEDLFNRASVRGYDPLSQAQYVDIKTYLVEDILTKVDRTSMANSLEVRVPFLDHKFMEFVSSIPSNFKLMGKRSKYIFKKAMERYLPKDILYRKKKGFEVPIGKWFKKELKKEAEDTIFNKNRGCFNTKFVKKLWNEHQKGISNHSPLLWCLFVFEKWCERWIDSKGV